MIPLSHVNSFMVRRLCLFAGIHFVVARRLPSKDTNLASLAPSRSQTEQTFTRLGRLNLSLNGGGSGVATAACESLEANLSIPPQWGVSSSPTSSISIVDGMADHPSVKLTALRTLGQQEQSTASAGDSFDGDIEIDLAMPMIPTAAWDSMTGDEFDNPSAIRQLTRSGLHVATSHDNEWIQWTATSDTQRIESSGNVMGALENGEVMVYVGKSKKNGHRGCDLPMIKTKSILPLSAEEMSDLLLDSSRVQIYNKMSLGRKDLKVIDDRTKIVRNLTKPPIAKSSMVSVTLMHARPLTESDKQYVGDNIAGGYVCISRACPAADTEMNDLSRNDILLGVNVLQELGPNECLMTAVTHVYSPALPKMLASKLGVSSATSFVKDIRNSCVPARN